MSEAAVSISARRAHPTFQPSLQSKVDSKNYLSYPHGLVQEGLRGFTARASKRDYFASDCRECIVGIVVTERIWINCGKNAFCEVRQPTSSKRRFSRPPLPIQCDNERLRNAYERRYSLNREATALAKRNAFGNQRAVTVARLGLSWEPGWLRD
jgi:hypothetical protein